MNLHITIRVTNPEVLAKGVQEVTEIDTDGMLIAANGLDGQQGAGMVMIGDIDPVHVAAAVQRSPMGDIVTAMMVSAVLTKAVVINRPGQKLRDVLNKMRDEMDEDCDCEKCNEADCPSHPSNAKTDATGCDGCADRDEPDKPGCGDPTCPHDPTFDGKIVQIPTKAD